MTLGGRMYDTSDGQIASLLENRELLYRALILAAREAAGDDERGRICRLVVWISDAAQEIASDRKAAN